MTHSTHPQAASLLHDRYGMKVATRLTEGASSLPHDISERLRASRVQAVARRKLAPRVAPACASSGAATLTMGDDEPGLWLRMASVMPLVALVAGLVAINVIQSEERASELAEVDTALLTDDLPPAAYADPGFLQFLRAGIEHNSP